MKSWGTTISNADIDRKRNSKHPPSKWVKASKFLEVYNWYPSHYSAYERSYLMKVDVAVVLFLGFTFCTKYSDQKKTSIAYVSGMRKD